MKELLNELLFDPGFRKMVLSNRRRKSIEYSKVMMRPVMVKGEKLVQAEYTFEKKVTHENLRFSDAVELALKLVTEDFKQINCDTQTEEIQVLCNKLESPKVSRKKKPGVNAAGSGSAKVSGTQAGSSITQVNSNGTPISESKMPEVPAINFDNNRQKHYIIPDGVPCDFLIRLGVMGEDGKVFQRSYSKFRQINRYLEIVEDCYPYLEEGDKPLKIIDFGCGKAYLTFALYYFLKELKGRNVEIIGLDLKKDVIEFCNKVAKDLGYDELKFLMGDIADYTSDNADMVVTLHACDTATDYALINAVSWGTKVILSVPCCQHELFKQIKNDIHDPMLKHGILKDRLTEYLTDGLRGLKLESKGYDVAMIEFTSLEHTARNIMIKAVKARPNQKKMDKAEEEFENLCEFYHVKPTITQL